MTADVIRDIEGDAVLGDLTVADTPSSLIRRLQGNDVIREVLDRNRTDPSLVVALLRRTNALLARTVRDGYHHPDDIAVSAYAYLLSHSPDPAALLPLRTRVRLVHGARDEAVPCAMSRDYAARAVGHGDDVLLDELAECGHYEPIDPLTAAWPSVLAALRAITTPSG